MPLARGICSQERLQLKYVIFISLLFWWDWVAIVNRHLLVYLQSQKAGIAVHYSPLIKSRISPATTPAQDSDKSFAP